MSDTIDIRPGFGDPVIASQRVFRVILDALSRPGRIGTVTEALDPPAPLAAGTAALCLALADHDTPLWLSPELRNPATTAFLRFHCGSPIVDDPAQAAFAIANADTVPALDRFGIGDDAWPETSTTLVVQVDELAAPLAAPLAAGGGLFLSGPGIQSEHRLSVAGLRDGIWDEWEANRGLFPCGIDLVLVAGTRLAALPRTTAVRSED